MPIIGQSSGTYCCAPGPLSNASNSLPNVMILGDSVSIGYTYHVVTNLSNQAFVQHSPWYTIYIHSVCLNFVHGVSIDAYKQKMKQGHSKRRRAIDIIRIIMFTIIFKKCRTRRDSMGFDTI